MEKRQVYSMSSSLYRGRIITEDWDTRFCGACLRIKTGKVIDYQIISGECWLSAPIPESVYCQCETRDPAKWPRYRLPLVLHEDEPEEANTQPDSDELAHIVTMDEAAFVRLLEVVTQEAAKICCQCSTAHNLVGDPPIIDHNGKRVYFCEGCWDDFLASSVVVERKP